MVTLGDAGQVDSVEVTGKGGDYRLEKGGGWGGMEVSFWAKNVGGGWGGGGSVVDLIDGGSGESLFADGGSGSDGADEAEAVDHLEVGWSDESGGNDPAGG